MTADTVAVAEVWRREAPHILTALLRRHGTDASTLDLLGVLRRSGPPYELTAGEIARRTRITTGGVSQRLARAERAGLVERRRAEGDSRSVTVRMTAAGMRLLDATVAELFAEEEATLTDEDLDKLRSADEGNDDKHTGKSARKEY